MTATVHVLKTTSAYFAAVWSGEKTFEVRYDDRGYQRGHQVRLREFDPTKPCEVCPRVPGEAWHTGPDCEKYSGREVHADIGHVMASTPQASKVRPGFNGHGYVVFSLLNVGTFDRSAVASVMAEVNPGISQRAADALADLVAADRAFRECPLPPASTAEAVRRIAAASGGEQS